MIIDASKTSTGESITADACIVGSGAAGVTLTLTLARAGQQVVLLEAGGLKLTEASQDFFRGESVGNRNHPLDELRQRQLGGTTGSWGGRCIPFDPIDFEQRDYIDNSGWPIEYNEVARYYPEALEWCHAGPAIFDAEQAGVPPLIPGFQDGDVKTSLLERWSLPTNFGKEYRDELEKHPNIRVFINAPCTDIILDNKHQ
ncbi:MAG: GMC family oxidoreductase, partial [Gammaproteobacteria bacterium]